MIVLPKLLRLRLRPRLAFVPLSRTLRLRPRMLRYPLRKLAYWRYFLPMIGLMGGGYGLAYGMRHLRRLQEEQRRKLREIEQGYMPYRAPYSVRKTAWLHPHFWL